MPYKKTPNKEQKGIYEKAATIQAHIRAKDPNTMSGCLRTEPSQENITKV